MGVSVIIPALNAEMGLGATLQSVANAEDVVVIDGGSHDATKQIAAAGGARVLDAPRGRGGQLQAGARAATQDWLLFLHADTVLAPDWRTHAETHMSAADARSKIAVFRFALDDRAWQARALEALVAARVRWLALPYGDQGLLIHRELYEEVGGYRPLPLMEDVDLVRRIGRKRLHALACRATTSARRWREDGWMARSARNLACLALFSFGAPVERIARFYER